MLGGKISGELTLTHLSKRPAAQVTATVHDLSLEAVSAALDTKPLERAAISGIVQGRLEGSWEGSGQNVQLRADATIAATAPARQGAGIGPNVIPLQGNLHLAYAARSGVMSVSQSWLATSHSSLKVDGSTGKQSNLAIQAQSDDLREVDQIVLIVRHAMESSGPTSPKSIEPLGIAGSATFNGQLRGSLVYPQLTGQLSSSNFQYRNTALSELQAGVELSPSSLTLTKGQLRSSEGGQVQFAVAAGLTNWAYSPQSPVRLDITAERLPVAAVERLANLRYPVSGTLAAHLSLHGSQSNVVGQGSATLTDATAWGQPIQDLSVQFQGAGDTIHSTLQLSSPAGTGSGKLTYDFKNQGYDALFNLSNIQLQRLQPAHYKKVQVSGVATASLQGRGTLKDPQLTATIESPKVVIGQQTLDGLKLHADVAHQQANFTLDSATVGASIQARGVVTLNADYSAAGQP